MKFYMYEIKEFSWNSFCEHTQSFSSLSEDLLKQSLANSHPVNLQRLRDIVEVKILLLEYLKQENYTLDYKGFDPRIIFIPTLDVGVNCGVIFGWWTDTVFPDDGDMDKQPPTQTWMFASSMPLPHLEKVLVRSTLLSYMEEDSF